MKVFGYVVYKDSRQVDVVETSRDDAMRIAEEYAAEGGEVEIQTTGVPTLFWYFDRDEGVWVSAQRSRW